MDQKLKELIELVQFNYDFSTWATSSLSRKGKKQFYEERKDFLDYEALTAFVKNEVSKQKPKELVELDQFSYDFPLGNLVTFKRGKKQFYEERKDFLDSEALTTFDENKVFDQKTKELVELDQFSYDFPLGYLETSKKQFYEERKDVPDSKGYTAIVENKVSNQNLKELVKLDQCTYDFFSRATWSFSRQAETQFYEVMKDFPDSEGLTTFVDKLSSD